MKILIADDEDYTREGLLEEIEASGEKFASALVEIEEIEHAGDDVEKLE